MLNSPAVKPITEAVKNLLWKNGEDCGCDKRKAALNRLFPNKDPLCLTEKEVAYWKEFEAKKTRTLSNQEAVILCNIWNRVFQTTKRYEPCRGCGAKPWQDMIDDVNSIYRTYL